MNLKSKKVWFEEKKLSWSEKFIVNILKCGNLPKHLAIIMDGNRRYAKKINLEQEKGYDSGFEKILRILNYCDHFDINEVTIFAFSIENFKRDQKEINVLMSLAIEKFSLLFDEREELMKNEICIRFIGNLNFLPVDLQKYIGELMLLTKGNKKKFLNICMSYTSRFEIANTVDKLYEAKNLNYIESEITLNDLNACLFTNDIPDPDILIRTSGEVRLSDFLLWQSNYTNLSFIKVLWPECSFYDFCKLILKYQMNKMFNLNVNLSGVIKSNSWNNEVKNLDLKNYLDKRLEKNLMKMKLKQVKQINPFIYEINKN